MVVAIIDTGIQPGIFPTGPIVYDLEVTSLGIVRKRKGKIHSFHGTFVAAILEKYAPGCQICSIKIFDDETQTTTCRMLCAALRWCRRNRIPFVNVSACSVEPKDFNSIGKTVSSLHDNKQIVIASYDKNGVYAMPAGHTAAIGVRTSSRLRDAEYMLDGSSSKQDYIASSTHKLQFISGKETITPLSTSFAVPMITAALVNKIVRKDRME